MVFKIRLQSKVKQLRLVIWTYLLLLAYLASITKPPVEPSPCISFEPSVIIAIAIATFASTASAFEPYTPARLSIVAKLRPFSNLYTYSIT